MTSASELFTSRRYRSGRGGDNELGISSSSSSSSYRDLHLHQHDRRRFHLHHHLRQQHQRRGEGEEVCDHVRRSSSARHTSLREHESVRVEHGTSQPSAGGSSSPEISSSGLRSSRNDRLPGAVLLARERLLERLRGVSVSGTRQDSRASSSASVNESAYGALFRLVVAGDWETETPRAWSGSQTDLLSPSQQSETKRAPGLSKEEVSCLQHELFNNELKSDGVVSVAAECCICLDKFQVGDSLLCLPCGHRFHSPCLDPWVRKCGDCPYCRTVIPSAQERMGKRAPN